MRKILQTLRGNAEVDEILSMAAKTTGYTKHHVRFVANYVRTYDVAHLKARQSLYKYTYVYIYCLRIYETIILPVVLYGCETWSLTLREEHRLRVFEDMVLRRRFGRGRDEVTGDWRKLHNEELHNLYSSPNIIRMIKSWRLRWAEHVARMGGRRMYIGYWWGSQKDTDH
jgi:hypothetical protein